MELFPWRLIQNSDPSLVIQQERKDRRDVLQSVSSTPCMNSISDVLEWLISFPFWISSPYRLHIDVAEALFPFPISKLPNVGYWTKYKVWLLPSPNLQIFSDLNTHQMCFFINWLHNYGTKRLTKWICLQYKEHSSIMGYSFLVFLMNSFQIVLCSSTDCKMSNFKNTLSPYTGSIWASESLAHIGIVWTREQYFSIIFKAFRIQ